MRHQNGGWRWLASQEMAYVRDNHGVVAQIIGAANDVTAREQAEHEREQQARQVAAP